MSLHSSLANPGHTELWNSAYSAQARLTQSSWVCAEQHLRFTQVVHPLVTKLFSREKTTSFHKERAWMICFMTGNACLVHLAEGLSTARFRNTCDPHDKQTSAIGMGMQVWVDSSLMSAIRGSQPPSHSDLPAQCAFALWDCSDWAPTHYPKFMLDRALIGLIEKKWTQFDFGPLNVRALHPTAGSSLSFNHSSFPIQVWTHGPRPDVLGAALAEAKAKKGVSREAAARFGALTVVKNYKQRIQQTNRKVEKQKGQITDMENNLKQMQVAGNQRAIEGLGRSIANYQAGLAGLKQTAERLQAAFTAFRTTDPRLPNSYREATFGIGAWVPSSDGDRKWKQYGEDGHIRTGDREYIRYQNDVHVRYGPKGLPIR